METRYISLGDIEALATSTYVANVEFAFEQTSDRKLHLAHRKGVSSGSPFDDVLHQFVEYIGFVVRLEFADPSSLMEFNLQWDGPVLSLSQLPDRREEILKYCAPDMIERLDYDFRLLKMLARSAT